MLKLSISFKLSAAIVSMMAGALLLISFLNYCNFDKDLQKFVQSRFQVLGKDIKGTIEYGLNLGLGLGEIKTIQKILEEKSGEQNINSLLVTDNRGKLLFHSNEKELTATQSTDWSQVFQNNSIIDKTTDITIQEKGDYLLIIPLINNFDVKVGSLVLSYPKTIIEQPQQNMIYFLAVRFGIIFAAFSIVIFIVSKLFFKHFFSDILSAIENSLKKLLENRDPDKELTDPDIEIRGDLKNRFITFHRKTRKLLSMLNRAATDLNVQRSDNGQ